MTKDEALDLALEALEIQAYNSGDEKYNSAITAIKQARLALVKQESKHNPLWLATHPDKLTTPPAAPVPLTDEQINKLRQQYGVTSDGRGIKEFTYVVDFARAIEAAHGITAAPEKGQP
jgi:hypothetical protein